MSYKQPEKPNIDVSISELEKPKGLPRFGIDWPTIVIIMILTIAFLGIVWAVWLGPAFQQYVNGLFQGY